MNNERSQITPTPVTPASPIPPIQPPRRPDPDPHRLHGRYQSFPQQQQVPMPVPQPVQRVPSLVLGQPVPVPVAVPPSRVQFQLPLPSLPRPRALLPQRIQPQPAPTPPTPLNMDPPRPPTPPTPPSPQPHEMVPTSDDPISAIRKSAERDSATTTMDSNSGFSKHHRDSIKEKAIKKQDKKKEKVREKEKEKEKEKEREKERKKEKKDKKKKKGGHKTKSSSSSSSKPKSRKRKRSDEDRKKKQSDSSSSDDSASSSSSDTDDEPTDFEVDFEKFNVDSLMVQGVFPNPGQDKDHKDTSRYCLFYVLYSDKKGKVHYARGIIEPSMASPESFQFVLKNWTNPDTGKVVREFRHSDMRAIVRVVYGRGMTNKEKKDKAGDRVRIEGYKRIVRVYDEHGRHIPFHTPGNILYEYRCGWWYLNGLIDPLARRKYTCPDETKAPLPIGISEADYVPRGHGSRMHDDEFVTMKHYDDKEGDTYWKDQAAGEINPTYNLLLPRKRKDELKKLSQKKHKIPETLNSIPTLTLEEQKTAFRARNPDVFGSTSIVDLDEGGVAVVGDDDDEEEIVQEPPQKKRKVEVVPKPNESSPERAEPEPESELGTTTTTTTTMTNGLNGNGNNTRVEEKTHPSSLPIHLLPPEIRHQMDLLGGLYTSGGGLFSESEIANKMAQLLKQYKESTKQ